jgi:hypothetical protein
MSHNSSKLVLKHSNAFMKIELHHCFLNIFMILFPTNKFPMIFYIHYLELQVLWSLEAFIISTLLDLQNKWRLIIWNTYSSIGIVFQWLEFLAVRIKSTLKCLRQTANVFCDFIFLLFWILRSFFDQKFHILDDFTLLIQEISDFSFGRILLA